MRCNVSWYRMGFAVVTLLAACAPGDRSNAPNELPSTLAPPAGAAAAGTILLQEEFEDNGFASRGWYDNRSITTTTVEHVPGSTRALELHWTAGSRMPTFGGAARHLFTATPTLYVNYWVKYSANWVGSGKGFHPHQFLVMSDQDGEWDGPSSNWLTAYIEDNYQNGGIPRLALQDNKAINTSFGTPPINLIGLTEDRSIGGCNGIVESGMFSECFNMPPWYNDKQANAAGVAFKPTPGPGYKGDWNEVEVYFQMNSIVDGIGQADGVMQYWFNGALVIDRHDVLFRTGARPDIKFNQFLIGPYMGDGSPVDQYMWVDNLTLATARAGTTPPPDSVAAGTPVVPVASVTIAPSSASLAMGATQQLTATLTDADGNTLTDRAVTWASSDPSVVSLSENGAATGASAGTATITATSEGQSGTAELTISDVPVATVTVSPASGSLLLGATQQLTATLTDADGNTLTDRAVTWASSDPSVVSLSENGAATGASAGTATITATSEGQSGTADVTVTATLTNPGTVTNVAVIAVDNSSVTLSFTEVNDGTGQPAEYDVRSAVGEISWGSATEVTEGTCQTPVAGTAIGAVRICTVLGLAPSTSYQFQLISFRGTLNVDAVFGKISNVVSATTTAGLVESVAPVATVSINPTSASVPTGQTVQLTATPRDASGNALVGRVVTWGSSNTTVATVASGGLVTAKVAGTATITATSEGESGTSAVTVTAVPPPPPPPSGGNWPNEPEGMTVRNDYGWTDNIGSGNIGSSGWATNGGNAGRVDDATAPYSPSSVMEIRFPVGFTGGVGPINCWYDIPGGNVKEIYVGFWWKVSNPWQGHPSNVNKIGFITTGGTQDALVVEMFGSSAPYKMRIAIFELATAQNAAYGGWLDNNVNNVTPTLGVWHRVEVYAKYGTSSTSNNGIVKLWMDGSLLMNYSDINFAHDGFDGWKINPTWGGDGSTKAENDFYWFDHVHTSTR